MKKLKSHLDVIDFWFSPETEVMWWQKDAAFDARIKALFLPLLDDLPRMESWPQDAEGLLARIITFDQAPRNIYRRDGRAFAFDLRARTLCRQILEENLLADLPAQQRAFALLPLEHSEALADQQDCVRLMTEWVGEGDAAEFAQKHLEIIQRFDRFPHRNVLLGRHSSAEEMDFLQQPGSGF